MKTTFEYLYEYLLLFKIKYAFECLKKNLINDKGQCILHNCCVFFFIGPSLSLTVVFLFHSLMGLTVYFQPDEQKDNINTFQFIGQCFLLLKYYLKSTCVHVQPKCRVSFLHCNPVSSVWETRGAASLQLINQSKIYK